VSEEIFYTSPNGDRWVLIRNENALLVEHRPNAGSGGRISRVSVADFLASGNSGPEHQMLRSMQPEPTTGPISASSDFAREETKSTYIARFSYDFHPADRDKAMEFIRCELDDAREIGLRARILVPFTRGPSSAAVQFEVELEDLNQLDEFRHRANSASLGQKSAWMHAFSSILRGPPIVEILSVHK
jgi:hypothetical protein